jgi:uncharacterized membrane protein
MKLRYLVKGLPGHPIHPPLTDVTIGTYTFATVAAVVQVAGITKHTGGYAWWAALIVGLVSTALTATTGLLDWLDIEWGTELWKTATWHMVVMVTATVFFGVAAIFGHSHYVHGLVGTGPFILTVIGFAVLAVGGWLGGTITFVHGMRVLNLVTEPTGRAVAPAPKPEKELAEGG